MNIDRMKMRLKSLTFQKALQLLRKSIINYYWVSKSKLNFYWVAKRKRNHMTEGGTLALNELANPNKWEDYAWLRFHNELKKYSIDKHCFNNSKEFAYRKGYEWTQCIYGLDALNAIQDNAKALGVGAGREPILFYLADRISEVIGIDLYGNDTWSSVHGKEADSAILTDIEKYCDRPFDKKKLSLKTMDGTKLDFNDEYFDFVWSLSSIEHFGGHNAAAKAVREMARVTKKKWNCRYCH